MASSVTTAYSNMAAKTAWDAQTGAVLTQTTAWAALTINGGNVPGTSYLDGTAAGGSNQLNGSSGYFSSGGASDAGQFCLEALNGSGFWVSGWEKIADSIPSGKCLFSCYNSNGYGVEVTLGADSNNNASAVPRIVVSHFGLKAGPAAAYFIREFTLTGDGSTYARLADGERHHWLVYMAKGIIKLFIDGHEQVFSAQLANDITTDWTWTNAVCTFGARKVGATIDRYCPASLQAMAIGGGYVDPAGLMTLLEAAQNSAGHIVDAYEFDAQTASMFTDVAGTIPAVTGDQVHAVTTSDGKLTATSVIQSGTIAAISAAASASITDVAHGLVSGQAIVITGSNCTPSIDGEHQITRIDADTFTVPVTTSGTGNAGTWTCKHGPYLCVDEAGKKYLRFPNRFQRRTWIEPIGNKQYWLDFAMTASTRHVLQGYSGLYAVGSLTVNALLGPTQQRIATFHDGSSVPRMGLGVDGTAQLVCGNVGATKRTSSSTAMKAPRCSPTVSCLGMTAGSLGVAIGSGTGETYCDGVTSALSGSLANGTVEFTAVENGSGNIKVGPLDTSNLSKTNTTCEGFDGRLYILRIVPRPITRIEFQRAEARDRTYLGLPMRPRALVRHIGDSVNSGEQDREGDGWQSRETGIRDCAMFNLSMAGAGLSQSTITTYYDFTLPQWHLPGIPTFDIWELSINDALNTKTYQQMAAALLPMVANLRPYNGAPVVSIAVRTPTSAGITPIAEYNTWVQTTASPFDYSFAATNPSLVSSPPTSDDTQSIHLNAYGHGQQATTASTTLAAAMLAAGVNASDSAGGRLDRLRR